MSNDGGPEEPDHVKQWAQSQARPQNPSRPQLRVAKPGETKQVRAFPTESFAEMEDEPWEWAIDRVLPLGEVTNLEGHSSAGKSSVFTSWAALLSRGEDLPRGQPLGEPVGTIIFTTEERPRKTINKRLKAMGANRRYVRCVNLRKLAEEQEKAKDDGDSVPGFTFPSGSRRLRETVREISVEIEVPVRLVIIDGVLSTMDSGLEMNDSQHVRRYMDALSLVAEDLKVSLLLVRHPSKSRFGPASQRGAGAGAWGDFVRTAWLVGVEPGTKAKEWRRVLVNLKPNAPIRDGLYFSTHWNQQFNEVEVEWGALCELTADEVYAGSDGRTEKPPEPKPTEEQIALVLKAIAARPDLDLATLTPKKVGNLVDGSGASKTAIWEALERAKAAKANTAPTQLSLADLRAGEKPDKEQS